jgi:hypothetical protein
LTETSPEIARFQLEQRVKASANWFYLIAALSIINSIISLAGGTWTFAVGLAITQVLDVIVGTGITSLRLVGVGLHLWLLAGFIALGHTARSRVGAFTIGIAVYGFDAVLCLPFQMWVSFGFHLFALFFIFAGRGALGRLSASTPDPHLPTSYAPTPALPLPLATDVPAAASAPTHSCQRCGTVLLGEGTLCVRCLSRPA